MVESFMLPSTLYYQVKYLDFKYLALLLLPYLKNRRYNEINKILEDVLSSSCSTEIYLFIFCIKDDLNSSPSRCLQHDFTTSSCMLLYVHRGANRMICFVQCEK